MPNLVTSYEAVDQLTGIGRLFYNVMGDNALLELTTPAGIDANVDSRPSFARYADRVLIGNFWEEVLVVDEAVDPPDVWQSGISAPTTAPTIVPGTGTQTVNSIGFYSFAQLDGGGAVVHQGDLGPPSDLVALNNEGRDWTNIPTTAPEPRVTHVRLWVSNDGLLPRLATEVTLGTATLLGEDTDQATLNESEAPPLKNDGSVDFNARGKWPFMKYMVAYHDSMWGSGDPDNPDRIYPSRLFEPESVDTTEDGPWLRALEGETVVGMGVHGDELIVFCQPPAVYSVQGYGPSSYRIRKINSFYGLLSHWSLAHVGPRSDLWAATQEGVVAYRGGGAFTLLTQDRYDEWKEEVRNNKGGFELSIAIQNRARRAYKLLVVQQDLATAYYWIGEYDVPAGDLPRWFNDGRGRFDFAIGLWYETQNRYQNQVVGGDDLILRLEDDFADPSDDSDVDQKVLDIVGPHHFMPDEVGDDQHGRSYTDMDMFVRNEDQDVEVELFAGDESAFEAAKGQHSFTVPASATPSRPRVAKTSHHEALNATSGKGVTVSTSVVLPRGIEYRGYAIHHREGPQERLELGEEE